MNQTIGRRFPDFELTDHDGQIVKLSQFAGKFPLIVTFYRGYWYLGRPTLEELRMDLREMMRKVRPDFHGPLA